MLASMEYTVRQPTFGELRRVALTNAVPFVGFGFMDNAIMVVVRKTLDPGTPYRLCASRAPSLLSSVPEIAQPRPSGL